MIDYVINELIDKYNDHLFSDVLSFWEDRTIDKEYGGYLTSFDKKGELIDTKKYMWLQCRQLWMFSAIYNNLDKDKKWLNLAKTGYEFIMKYGYAQNGRWNYCLSQKGEVIKDTISIYTDMFALAALCEYSIASKNNESILIIRETFKSLNENIRNPEFVDVFPYKADSGYIRHGVYSIALNSVCIAKQVLGEEETMDLIELCLNNILYVFAKDEYKVVFEALSKEGEIIDDAEGKLINPGHILQSAWFCIETAKEIKNEKYLNRAVEIAKWGWNIGEDKEYGGLISFTDKYGEKPEYTQWHKNKSVLWDDKIWWANAEALYTLLIIALESGEKDDFDKFINHQEWCFDKFFDRKNGEWFTKLHRNGTPINENKGNSEGIQKCAYHLPRALMKILILLKKYKNEV